MTLYWQTSLVVIVVMSNNEVFIRSPDVSEMSMFWFHPLCSFVRELRENRHCFPTPQQLKDPASIRKCSGLLEMIGIRKEHPLMELRWRESAPQDMKQIYHYAGAVVSEWKAGFGDSRSKMFRPESESELESINFCRLRLRPGVAGSVLSIQDDYIQEDYIRQKCVVCVY